MSETKHTPGPWVALGTLVYMGNTGDFKNDGSPNWGGIDTKYLPNQEHDAALIAAAPELLAALEQCLGQMTGGMDGRWDDVDAVEMARKAIAKAKGKG